MPAPLAPERDIYSVSRLNSEVRASLEGGFPRLWIEGELSNLATPRSGHLYFSLKDAHAQVRCAMFRQQRLLLRAKPENGQQVLVRARLSLYEPRGDYQLIVEHMEPAGDGQARLAFEALKRKLAAEGLFDTERKQPLPELPRRIGVLTSPSGAALHDIREVLRTRMPSLPLVLYPIPVQGDVAEQIVAMLELADERAECDLLILARGGGSAEDLAVFNDERIARAIAKSSLPLVSAIGHEIDFTIADFVADARAPTPSAAAEMVSPDRRELLAKADQLSARLLQHTRAELRRHANHLVIASKRLASQDPRRRLQQRQQRLDELGLRLERAWGARHGSAVQRLASLEQRLHGQSPTRLLAEQRHRLNALEPRLAHAIKALINHRREQSQALAREMVAVSPLATLGRGYSITRRMDNRQVMKEIGAVTQGDRIETLLSDGKLLCQVESVESGPVGE